MDTIRLRKAGFNEWLFKKLSFLMKEEERSKVSGMSWLFISLWAVVYFFEKEIAILAMVISILYDLFSATGKVLGRIKLGRRSLEGCAIGFIVAFGIGYIIKDILMLKGNVVFFASLTAVLTELFPTKIDDNLTIPFFTALVAQFVKNSF
jgi:dolichol kinase